MDTGFAGAPLESSDASVVIAKRLELTQRVRGGASWFYWIAGLSILNSIIQFTGGNWHFIFGLGITSIVDAVAANLGKAGIVLDLIINVFIAGIFVIFGVFANKLKSGAFLAGMVLYGLDGLLSLLIQDWFGLAFHAFALYSMWRGFAALKELNSLGEAPAAQAAVVG